MENPEPKKNPKGGRPKGSTKAKIDPFREVRVGRPDVLVPDEKTMKALRRYGAANVSYETMAANLGVSLTALNNFRKKWPEVDIAIDQGRSNIDIDIAVAQIDVAVKKRNPQMLIWLGKQRLGQTDKVETKNTGDISIHIDAEDAQV
ncbi:hypothetical protein NKJ26_03035 [Mesorhizobium sp. M0152]|uniref:hypothetical protein n=1 Tax=Mesorhizobium sp. M0152 TaxID=2956898 RepID=UPI0033358682